MLIAWLSAFAIACGTPDQSRAPAPRVEAPAGAPVAASAPSARERAPRSTRSSVGFHSSRQFAEHYEKHGAEFGPITREEYLERAQQLRDARVGGDILELRRDDGVVTRYDRASGAFIAFDDDGTIRTFFRPNAGESYFRRQARRR